MNRSVGLLIALTAAIYSYSAFSGVNTPTDKEDAVRTFYSVYTTSDICVDIPEGTIESWEKLAKANVLGFDLYSPDEKVLRKHYYEPGATSYVPYKAELPDVLRNVKWQLIFMGGVKEAEAQYLVGKVAYGLSDEKGKFDKTPHFAPAQACFDVSKDSTVPIFATISTGDDQLSEVNAKLQSYEMRFKTDSGSFAVETPSSNLMPIKTYSVRDKNEIIYMVIEWPNDHGCHTNWQLIAVFGGNTKSIGSNGGGCD